MSESIVADTLRPAQQRLTLLSGRPGLLTVAATVALFSNADFSARADVEYDYLGNNFVQVTGAYSTHDHVTGDIILGSPLPVSTQTFNPSISSYSFTDGLNTIASTTPGVNPPIASNFITNNIGNILDGQFIVATDTNVGTSSYTRTAININDLGDTGYTSFGCCYTTGSSFSPGIWTGPTAVSSYKLYVTLEPSIRPTSTNPKPTRMVAVATVATSPPPLASGAVSSVSHGIALSLPASVTSPDLLQAAKALNPNFVGLDWTQTLTQWVNPNELYPASAPTKPLTVIPPKTSPDPVTGGFIFNGTVINSYATEPFYYNTNTSALFDRSSVDANTNSTLIKTTLASASDCGEIGAHLPSGSMLCFADTPNDPHLTADEIAQDQMPKWSTSLVGIIDCATPGEDGCNANGEEASVPLFTWIWQDTFSMGGVALTASDGLDDPSAGTGGITVLSINGVSVTGVPEPSSLTLVGVALGVLALWKWPTRRPGASTVS